MKKAKGLFVLLAACLVYALVVVIVNIVAILVILKDLSLILYPLQIVTLTEGGVGLMIGGVIGSNSPSIAKIEETLFHTKPKSQEWQRDTQKKAKPWIITGVLLVLVALLLSVV